MLRIVTCAFSLFVAYASVGYAQDPLTDETKEPPLRFRLQIGERSLTLQENESVKLKEVLQHPEVRLTIDPHRVFACGGITFNYPRRLVFKANRHEDTRIWALDGDHIFIQYVVSENRLTPLGMANQMIERVGEKNSRIVNHEAKSDFGETALEGVVVEVTLLQHSMRAEFFGIPTEDGTSRVLVIQDNLEDGQPSAERGEIRELFKSSFRVTH